MNCSECGKPMKKGKMFCECGHDRTAHLDWGNTTHEERMAAIGYTGTDTDINYGPPGKAPVDGTPQQSKTWCFPIDSPPEL